MPLGTNDTLTNKWNTLGSFFYFCLHFFHSSMSKFNFKVYDLLANRARNKCNTSF